MSSSQKTVLSALLAVACGLNLFGLGLLVGRTQSASAVGSLGSDAKRGMEVITEAYNKILGTSVAPPSVDELTRGAIRGMIRVLRHGNDDPYALFYTPFGYQAFLEQTTGRFSGIGVLIEANKGPLTIDAVLPDGPAAQAGLRAGDVIRAIDGTPAAGLTIDVAADRIKGPVGSVVSLKLARDGRMFVVSLTRESIELPNLTGKLIGGKLGYVRLVSFARNAGDQLHERIESLMDNGARGIVLDLRDNGGGLFTEAVEVASVFIEDGDVVIYRERNGDDVVYEAEGNAFEDVPLVVLVNGGTASASEIVAGALQDRERAIIVGTQTYGKGSVQEVVRLLDESAVKLTIAAYLTPDGRTIDGRGITPDVLVDADRAVQRQRALRILRGLV